MGPRVESSEEGRQHRQAQRRPITSQGRGSYLWGDRRLLVFQRPERRYTFLRSCKTQNDLLTPMTSLEYPHILLVLYTIGKNGFLNRDVQDNSCTRRTSRSTYPLCLARINIAMCTPSRSGRVALESNDAGIATTVSTELGAKYQKRKVCRTTSPGTHDMLKAYQPTTGSPHVHAHVAARDARRVQ